MQRNTVVQGDCLQLMRELPDGCIPLTVTSPPYGDLRTYGGHEWDFHGVANELFRITAPGGVVVWVVQEQIVNGSESGESSRQRLAFADIGFRLYHTMVMGKTGGNNHLPGRYGKPLEYAFILSKGRPRYVCLIRDKRNKEAGKVKTFMNRRPDGSFARIRRRKTHPNGIRPAVWFHPTGGNVSAKDRHAFKHPAIMPEQMAEDHIRSWSRVGDLVFDPFAGAGTTLKMARLNYRSYLGFELNPDYVRLAEQRLAEADAAVHERAEAHVGRFRNLKLSA